MKLKTYIIPPLSHMNLALNGDNLFALAQYTNDSNEQYIKFFQKNKHRYTTIDSGVAEDNTVSAEELIDRAKLINANEIIAPDILYDNKATLKATSQFIFSLSKKEKKQFKIMAVPQGKTIRQWIYCYKTFSAKPDIDVIGLSKFSVNRSFFEKTQSSNLGTNRVTCLDYLASHNLFKKPIHLLGLHNAYELLYYHNFDYIRSCDSNLTISCAINKIDISKQMVEKPSIGNKYFHMKLRPKTIKLANKNISYLKYITDKK